MSEPLFRHDCKNCQFLGTFYGKDVYYCPAVGGSRGGSLLARNSDFPQDYTSTDIVTMLPRLSDPSYLMEDRTVDPAVVKPYMTWIWDKLAENDAVRAWVVALAVAQIRQLVGKEKDR